MKKWVIILLSVLFCGVLALMAAHVIGREINSRYGRNENGKLVIFDSRVASVIGKIDRQMEKEGYIIDKKTVGSGEDHGTEQLMPHNGVNMRLLNVKNTYSRPGDEESGVVCEDTVIECRFLLIEDNNDRLFGGDYYAYSGTMQRSDCVTYGVYDENGEVIDTEKEKKVLSAKHFGGNLDWLKEMAYNNYIAQVELTDAFESYR